MDLRAPGNTRTDNSRSEWMTDCREGMKWLSWSELESAVQRADGTIQVYILRKKSTRKQLDSDHEVTIGSSSLSRRSIVGGHKTVISNVPCISAPKLLCCGLFFSFLQIPGQRMALCHVKIAYSQLQCTSIALKHDKGLSQAVVSLLEVEQGLLHWLTIFNGYSTVIKGRSTAEESQIPVSPVTVVSMARNSTQHHGTLNFCIRSAIFSTNLLLLCSHYHCSSVLHI